MNDRPILVERGLPADSNVTLFLDSLVCILFVVAVLSAFGPWQFAIGVFVSAVLVFLIALWKRATAVRRAANAITKVAAAFHEVTPKQIETLRLLKTPKYILQELSALKGQKMTAAELVASLEREIPRPHLINHIAAILEYTKYREPAKVEEDNKQVAPVGQVAEATR